MIASSQRKVWLNTMAASKKKKVSQKEVPKNNYVGQVENPDDFYDKNPSWNFASCDDEFWPFTEQSIGSCFWNEILPFFRNLESMKWKEILLEGKKQHHSIDVRSLNSVASKRLSNRYIEQDSIYSLRLTGTHRVYGYIINGVFHILWYDPDHGDNDTCVCRSVKKHT